TPVRLPPGCARLSTRPAPTGSLMTENTIGTVRVACCSAARNNHLVTGTKVTIRQNDQSAGWLSEHADKYGASAAHRETKFCDTVIAGENNVPLVPVLALASLGDLTKLHS